MENERDVGRLLDREAHLFDQVARFMDIRKKPQIRLQDIIMCLLFMPFFSLTSLLGLGRTARKYSFKRLFASQRKMVVSATTVARVLNWLDETQAQQLQGAFLEMFDHHGLAKRELMPGGKARRLGIIDGSCMGDHYLSMLNLRGKTYYHVMLVPYAKQGKELPASRLLLQHATTTLGAQFPELLLLDGEYFTRIILDEVASAKACLLIKNKEPFRDVHQDTQLLFKAKARLPDGIIEESGFDVERCCHWSIEITSGQLVAYPVQVAHLVEDYPKRKGNTHVECWIVTTEMSPLPSEIRQAAHLR